MSPGGGWRTSLQLGSLLGDAEDVTRRISIASQAYGKMYSLWMRRNHVSEKVYKPACLLETALRRGKIRCMQMYTRLSDVLLSQMF